VRVDPDAYDPLDPDANQTLVTSGDLLNAPRDVAIDLATGDAYVPNFSTHSIVRVTPGGAQSLVAQGGTFTSPRAIAIEDDGKLLAPGLPNTILRIDPDAFVPATPASNQTTIASGGELFTVNDVALEAGGTLVATDLFLFHVVRIDPDAYDPLDPDANQDIVASGNLLTTPLAIAVVPEAGAGSGAVVAVAAVLAWSRRR
jgi:hypothetical protein